MIYMRFSQHSIVFLALAFGRPSCDYGALFLVPTVYSYYKTLSISNPALAFDCSPYILDSELWVKHLYSEEQETWRWLLKQNVVGFMDVGAALKTYRDWRDGRREF
jgi:hypothetical protein